MKGTDQGCMTVRHVQICDMLGVRIIGLHPGFDMDSMAGESVRTRPTILVR